MPEKSIKAVISAAGFGSRCFPITKVINKCMLPIGNRPVIDFLVTELIDAGIKDIAFVTPPGDIQIRNYFSPETSIKSYFQSQGWDDKYRPLQDLEDKIKGINFCFIEQPQKEKYGTAIPGLLARSWVGESNWLLLSGDDLVIQRDGCSDIKDLILAHRESGADASMQVAQVQKEDISRYGIVETKFSDKREWFLKAIEKPKKGATTSRLASISRFLLGSDFFERLDELKPEPSSGEYLSMRALLNYAENRKVLVKKISGEYFDCGQTTGWLKANTRYITYDSKSL